MFLPRAIGDLMTNDRFGWLGRLNPDADGPPFPVIFHFVVHARPVNKCVKQ